MRRSYELAVFLVVLGLGLPVVRADEDGPAPVDTSASLRAGEDDFAGDDKKPTDGTERPPGAYMGVVPGASEAPAVPGVEAGSKPVLITWPGFQMRPDGTSRVFVQSTAPISVESQNAAGKFTLKFPGAKVAGDTNRLPLETRYFNTPVTRVSIAQTRDAVIVTLDLRAQITPTVTSERGASGFHFTYVDLPAGNYAEAARTAAPTRERREQPHADVTPSTDASPDHLDDRAATDGRAKSGTQLRVRVDTSMDKELPPGVKPKAQTKAGIKLGK